jgi:hypothetical protein
MWASEAVGFDADTAAALGIGYASRGTMKGLVLIPLRTDSGALVGYAGVSEAKLPATFHFPSSNVVPLKRGA